jgi:hypothetical protein
MRDGEQVTGLSMRTRIARVLVVFVMTATVLLSFAKPALASWECGFDGPFAEGMWVYINYWGYTTNPDGGVAIVDWGDGTLDDWDRNFPDVSGQASHTYASPGSYLVTLHFGPCHPSQTVVVE